MAVAFISMIESVDPGTTTTYNWDLESLYGVPAGSPVMIIAENKLTNGTHSVQVINDSLTKGFSLTEAEDGGSTCARFIINTKSDGTLDVYGGSPLGERNYSIVGYFTGVVWTDQWEYDSITRTDDDQWFEFTAARISLQTDRVHLITIHHDDIGKDQFAGVRTTGSSIDRLVLMMESEGGGDQIISMFVHTDASDGNIEVYTDQFDDHVFRNQGYFDSSVTFTEKFGDIDGYTSLGGAFDEDVTTLCDSNDAVLVDSVMCNTTQAAEVTMGARTKGSGLNRNFTLREAEGGGESCVCYSTVSDSEGVITYTKAATSSGESGQIWLTGYFNFGAGAAGTAYQEAPTDALTLTGTWERDWSIQKTLINVANLTSNLADKIQDISREYLDTITLVNPAIASITQKNQTYQETMNLTPVYAEIVTWLREYLETATLTPVFADVPSQIELMLETLTLTSTYTEDWSALREFAETITQLQSITKIWTSYQERIETLTLVSTLLKDWTALRELSDTITLIDPVVGAVHSEGVQVLEEVYNETITLLSTIVKDLSTVKTDTITLTSTFLKDVTLLRLLSENSTLVLTLLKDWTILREYSDTVTLIDTWAKSWTLYAEQLETVNLTDTLIRDTINILTQALSLTDTYLKDWTVLRTYEEDITLTDTIPVLIVTQIKELIETLNLTVTMLKDWIALREFTENETLLPSLLRESVFLRQYSDTITLVNPAITAIVIKIQDLIETINLTATFTKDVIWTRTLEDTLTLITDLIRDGTFTLIELLNLTATWTKDWSMTSILSDTVNLNDTLINDMFKELSNVITLTDTITTSLGEIFRTFYETITLISTLIPQSTGVFTETLEETLILLDTYLEELILFRTLSDIVNLTDTALTVVANVTEYIETLNLTDTFIRQTTLFRILNDTIILVDDVIPLQIGAIQTLLEETLTLIPIFSKSISYNRTYIDILTLIDSVIRQTAGATVATLNETLNLTVTFLSELILYRVFSNTLTLTDSVLKGATKIASDALGLGDSWLRVWTILKVYQNGLSITDTIPKQVNVPKLEQFTMVDGTTFGTTKVLNQYISILITMEKTIDQYRIILNVLSLIDTVTSSVVSTAGKTFTETMTLTDTLTKDIYIYLSEVASLLVTFIKQYTGFRELIEAMTVSDTFTKALIQYLILTETLTLTATGLRMMIQVFTEAISLTDVTTIVGYWKIIKQRIFLRPAARLGHRY